MNSMGGNQDVPSKNMPIWKGKGALGESSNTLESDPKRVRLIGCEEYPRGLQEFLNHLSQESNFPLGLSLPKTPSFVNLIEAQLLQGRQPQILTEGRQISPPPPPPPPPPPQVNQTIANMKGDASEQVEIEIPFKAANISARLLKIGYWERVAYGFEDVVAKFYYAKRRVVWELFEMGYKKKIEIKFSNIAAIRAVCVPNQNDILEIEMNTVPDFYQERNIPRPRKPLMWKLAPDPTGGQALRNRRHSVEFPEGTLMRHYKKLVRSDIELFKLNNKPFSSTPYFELCKEIPPKYLKQSQHSTPPISAQIHGSMYSKSGEFGTSDVMVIGESYVENNGSQAHGHGDVYFESENFGTCSSEIADGSYIENNGNQAHGHGNVYVGGSYIENDGNQLHGHGKVCFESKEFGTEVTTTTGENYIDNDGNQGHGHENIYFESGEFGSRAAMITGESYTENNDNQRDFYPWPSENGSGVLLSDESKISDIKNMLLNEADVEFPNEQWLMETMTSFLEPENDEQTTKFEKTSENVEHLEFPDEPWLMDAMTVLLDEPREEQTSNFEKTCENVEHLKFLDEPWLMDTMTGLIEPQEEQTTKFEKTSENVEHLEFQTMTAFLEPQEKQTTNFEKAIENVEPLPTK